MPILTGHSKQFILDLVLGFVATPTGPADFAETVWRVLQHGDTLMARTTFSGPVASTAGFEGDITGDVTGAVDASAGTLEVPQYTVLTVPSAATVGQIIVVTDATSAGTGTICFSNGTSWIDVYTGVAVA